MTDISSPAPGPAVATRGLALSYGDTAVLRGVDLSLAAGSTLALLGPSGCGKTTLLRLLAGLLAPTRGMVAIGGTVMADAASGAFVPPERRGLGMVFQDYALWPHMNVAANVAFPLEMAGVARREIEPRVRAALRRVGLEAYATRGPGELSGGQQQRVAIARAIVAEPRVVLFDEPLSNLDRELRESLALELAQLVASLSLTAVYVTHDHGEAFTIADQVAVMQHGEIAQLATPQDLVEAPASPAIAEFLKLGTVADAARENGAWRLAGTEIPLPDGGAPRESGRARVLLGRKALRLTEAGAVGAHPARVLQAQFRGDAYNLTLAVGEGAAPLRLQATSELRRSAGQNVGLVIEPQGLRWFPAMS